MPTRQPQGPPLIVGHIYRTRRRAFWLITEVEAKRGYVWVMPYKGDPRSVEWLEQAHSEDLMTACGAFGGMVRKPIRAVLDNIAEDITAEISTITFMLSSALK